MPFPKLGAYIFLFFFLFGGYSSVAQYSQKELQAESDALFDKGAYSDAMTGYAQLLSLEPTNPFYSYRYGATALYGDPTKREEAIKYLRFASKKPGVESLVWYFLGRAYHLNYQFADAIQAYEKFRETASRKEADQWQIERVIRTAVNGQDLLSQIKEVTVIDKKKTSTSEFFRIYDLADIGGRILVTPDELLTSLDVKNGHKSLIHFRGDGTTVYFSSYGKDGKNGLDIYAADVLPGGTFSEPRRLPSTINTPYDEDFPYMHPDGRTLYFSSKGHTSMGGYDIFRSTYDRSSGAFGSPQNMDFAVNTPDDDIFYIADSLNRRANFASGRNSRQGELHVYRVEVDMQPVELTLIKGTFANQINTSQRTAKITVVDAATNARKEVQYTDPTTGDYLLSFPKSGKYKLLVEAQGSAQVHSGIVNVPASDGLTAYLQEMELVMPSGVERLLINNLFDRTYDGDVAALAREMLRKRAALEVNFDTAAPEPEMDMPADDQVAMDVSKAYNAAGFGAGLSNEKVLSNAENRLDVRHAKIEELRNNAAAAAFESEMALDQATALLAEATELAKSGSEVRDEGEVAFEAAVLQWRAAQATERARVAQELQATLDAKSNELERQLESEQEEVTALREAIGSGDFYHALSALTAENERIKNEDKLAERAEMLKEIGKMNSAAQEEAQRFNDRAVALRNETDALVANRVTKRRQLSNAKGKAAKQHEEELQRLELEIEDMETATARAYAQAGEKEKRSNQLREQLALLEDIKSGSIAVGEEFVPKRSSETAAKIDKLEGGIGAIKADDQLVQTYVAAHPEALASLGSHEALRDFQKSTGISIKPTAEVRASLRKRADDDPASMQDTDKRPSQTRPAENLTSLIGGNEQAQSIPKVKTQPLDDATLMAQNELEDLRDVEKATARESSAQTQQSASPSLKVNAEAIEEYSTETLEEKVATASDWIEIIDGSIAELKGENNDDNEEVQAKLQEFQELRAAKVQEIAIYEDRLAALGAADELQEEGEGTSAEEATMTESYVTKAQSEVDVFGEKAYPSVSYVEEAIAELETLDPALVSRLESKINEASSSPAFVEHVSLVSPAYIPDLESIEMSGKSPAEMSAERIALNEHLVTEIRLFEDELEEGSGARERLTELRRIKALEILEDREVMEGLAAFIPRTTAALAYRDMLSDAPSNQQKVGAPTTTLEKRAIWSPAIEASLKKPYSWDDILPGYIDMIEEDVNESTETSFLQKRVESHEAMLAHLVEEIDIYQLLLNDPKAADDIRVKERYEQLLLEKSTIEALKAEDRALLVNPTGALAVDADISGPAQNANDEGQGSERPVSHLPMDEEWPDPATNKAFIEDVLGRMEMAYTAFAKAPVKDSEGLDNLAELNRSEAATISERIEALTQNLDATLNDAPRDAIQIQIQELDNLLADRLQEADRLSAEAEALRAVHPGAEPEAQTDTDTDATAEVELPADLLELEDIQHASSMAIKLDGFQYRSLEANMSGSQLAAQAKTSKALREKAEGLIKAYKETKIKAERLELYEDYQLASAEVIQADMELSSAVRKANAAETRFYMQSSQARLDKLSKESIAPEDRISIEDMEKRLKEIDREVEINRELWDELDAHDTAAHSDMLYMEMAFIEELDRLSSELDDIQERAKTAADLRSTETQEAATEIADVPPTTESDETADAVSAEQPERRSENDNTAQLLNIKAADPLAHAPLVGRRYTTPTLKQAAGLTTQDDRDEFARRNPVLHVKLAAIDVDGVGDDESFKAHPSLIQADPSELELVLSAPKERKFLSALITADTLKNLEKSHEAEMELYYNKARESSTEVVRLRSAKALESGSQNRSLIEDRAQRMENQSIEAYKRAAFAAERADAIRELRKDNETMLAQASSALKPNQKERVQNLLTLPPYIIVPSDLASTEERPAGVMEEPSTQAPVQPESATTPDQVAEAIPDRRAASVPSAVPDTPPVLAEDAPGYWLSMVEVIAEKDDFSDVNSNMFVVADKEVYSASKPIPMDPEMPSGLIFQVQIGAFRNPISPSLFGAIAPIMGQKLDNGIIRYRAGLFKSYRVAIEARDDVRAMGYSDAFVVAYVDGERLSPEQARSMVAQAQALLASEAPASKEDAAQSAPVTAIDTERAVIAEIQQASATYYDDPDAADAVQVEIVRGLFYTVQVGVYSKPVKFDQLFNLSNLNSELTSGGLIRYTTGRYKNVAEASGGKAEAVIAGVSDAFVTAYFNGTRISLNEAKAILDREGEDVLNIRMGSVSPEQSHATFVVVFAKFSGDVPQEVAEVLLALDNISLKLVEGEGGEQYYISQEYNLRETAERLLSQLHNLGLSDAYLAALDGDSMQPLR